MSELDYEEYFIFNLVNLNKYKRDINRRSKGILK